MKPIYFEDCNCNFALGQDEYLTLPAHRDDDGIVTSCWKPTFMERLQMFVSGKVFIQIMTFNKPLQPQKISSYNPIKIVVGAHGE